MIKYPHKLSFGGDFMANDRNAGRKRTLTEKQEQEIYDFYLKDMPVARLSLDYNVSISTICRIIRRYKSKILIF